MHLSFLSNGVTIFQVSQKSFSYILIFIYFFFITADIGAIWLNSKNNYNRDTCLNLHINLCPCAVCS